MHMLMALLESCKETFGFKKLPTVETRVTEKAHNRTRTGYFLLNNGKVSRDGVEPGQILELKPGELSAWCRKQSINYTSVMSYRSQFPTRNIPCNKLNYNSSGWVLLAKNATNEV